MTRIDYLMQDREKVIQFINQLIRQIFSNFDQDCQGCPFCNEEGILLGCNISAEEDSVECAMNKYDIEDFLLEEMPSKNNLTLGKTCKKNSKYKGVNNGK